MKRIVSIALLALASTACSAGDEHDKINGSVQVEAGQTAEDVSTVNGSIRVGDGATIRDAETVNGSITLGDRVKASGVENVNGSIKLGAGTTVTKSVETVNGSISLEKAADVAGRVENVNGKITLTEAHVGGGIETVAGDIEVGADSRVEGGLKVSKTKGINLYFGKKNVPKIVIGPGATVEGPLKFEREVKLYVSDSATIGPVEGATAIKFSGDKPPE